MVAERWNAIATNDQAGRQRLAEERERERKEGYFTRVKMAILKANVCE